MNTERDLHRILGKSERFVKLRQFQGLLQEFGLICQLALDKSRQLNRYVPRQQ